MVSEEYKKKVDNIMRKARKQGKITKYSDFCKTKLAKETALTEEETKYYISKKKEGDM